MTSEKREKRRVWSRSRKEEIMTVLIETTIIIISTKQIRSIFSKG